MSCNTVATTTEFTNCFKSSTQIKPENLYYDDFRRLGAPDIVLLLQIDMLLDDLLVCIQYFDDLFDRNF